MPKRRRSFKGRYKIKNKEIIILPKNNFVNKNDYELKMSLKLIRSIPQLGSIGNFHFYKLLSGKLL